MDAYRPQPGSEPGVIAALNPAPELGDQLKRMFGDMTAGPMPSRLVELADALEAAFQRGELVDKPCRRSRAS